MAPNRPPMRKPSVGGYARSARPRYAPCSLGHTTVSVNRSFTRPSDSTGVPSSSRFARTIPPRPVGRAAVSLMSALPKSTGVANPTANSAPVATATPLATSSCAFSPSILYNRNLNRRSQHHRHPRRLCRHPCQSKGYRTNRAIQQQRQQHRVCVWRNLQARPTESSSHLPYLLWQRKLGGRAEGFLPAVGAFLRTLTGWIDVPVQIPKVRFPLFFFSSFPFYCLQHSVNCDLVGY